jgi:hypothetical protein
VRAKTANDNLDRLLETLRQQRARLVSVTPLQGTLEEYFLSKTSEPETATV